MLFVLIQKKTDVLENIELRNFTKLDNKKKNFSQYLSKFSLRTITILYFLRKLFNSSPTILKLYEWFWGPRWNYENTGFSGYWSREQNQLFARINQMCYQPYFSCFFKSVLLLRTLSPWKDFYCHLSSSDSTVPSFATWRHFGWKQIEHISSRICQ